MTTMRMTAARLGILVSLASCSKHEAPAPAETRAATPASATSDASVAEKLPDAGASGPLTFSGKYTVTAGSMYVPKEKEYASVKFKNDETAMLGEGELTVTIAPGGRVAGTTESGPLGAAVLDGYSDKGTVSAVIRRKNVADQGLTGTLLATVTGDALDGTMNLAESNAAVVRVARLVATKK
jgi:hypothetical protein